MTKIILVLGFSVASFLLGSCNQSSKTKTLFLAHSLPQTHPVHKGIVYFQSQLAEISGGKLKIKIFSDGQLGSEREVLELLQIGSIAITKVSAGIMANFSPSYEVLGIPYLFRDKEHLFNVLEGEVGKEMLEGSSDFLLRGLCFYDAGSRSFYTKDKPIRTPDDLKGLKLRVMNQQMSIELVNSLGGSATPMAFGELYTALQQGVVDGAENNPPSLVSSNHFQVCKYYTLDEHTSIPDVLVISTKYWDALSEQEKEWIETAAKSSVPIQKQYWAQSVQECLELLVKNKVEIIRPDKVLFEQRSKHLIEELLKDEEKKIMIERVKSY
ncbi:TRAP transporter substrate-binding protein [Reichenbachiella sp. MALMAid0571]|uniref:TRAP transporter substrate-binding protein n=1 Tax=Reichenbachiella sp. MALMAid0571 TaxID=3143939 RepID=UPI0032DF93BC